MKNRLDRATLCAHTVRAPNPETLPDRYKAVPSAEPLYQTTAFDFPSIEASSGPLEGVSGYVYSRYGLPNGRTLEGTMAALEGGEAALATSSGMAALSATLLACARPGERVLFQADAYGGTVALLTQDFVRLGIVVEPVDVYDHAAVKAALGRMPRALVVETISNPLCREPDLAGLAALCRGSGTLLVVDNTFATPILARPLEKGAHAVVHSASKFLGGHHDLTAGVLVGETALVAEARGVAKRFGAVVAPFDAWLTSRGIKSLAVRMERAQQTAGELVRRLGELRRVSAVHYPGWGPMLSFDVGDEGAARRVVAALELIPLVPSLGGTNTSVSHAATSSHRMLSPETRRALGITDGLLRISTGLEAVEDLWNDLSRAIAGS